MDKFSLVGVDLSVPIVGNSIYVSIEGSKGKLTSDGNQTNMLCSIQPVMGTFCYNPISQDSTCIDPSGQTLVIHLQDINANEIQLNTGCTGDIGFTVTEEPALKSILM
jgi:hypothetical protein